MFVRSTIGAIAIAAALHMAVGGAAAFDETKYPEWKGQWARVVAPRWVPAGTKPPLTPEYQAIFEANLKDQAAGKQGWIQPTPASRPACTDHEYV